MEPIDIIRRACIAIFLTLSILIGIIVYDEARIIGCMKTMNNSLSDLIESNKQIQSKLDDILTFEKTRSIYYDHQ